MAEWTENKLGDLVTHKKGFAFKSDLFGQTGDIVVKVSDTTNDSINISNCARIRSDMAQQYNDVRIKYNDIIVATVGSWPDNPKSIVGKVVRVPKEADNALLNQNTVRLRAKEDKVQTFLYYRLKCKDFSEYLINGAQGSANQASITLVDIFNFPINVPDNGELDSIVDIICCLDDKIDLLQRQNKTLEALAETLFRQWFVEEADDGWETGKLGNYVQFLKGKKPNEALEEHLDGLVPQLLIETFDTGQTLFSEPQNMVIANEKDILMVMDGASSGRVEIGFCGIVGSTIGLFRPILNFNYPLFIFYLLKTSESYIREHTTGSAIPHADKSLILNLDIQYPSIERIIEFENVAEGWFEKKKANRNQTAPSPACGICCYPS